MFGGLVFPVVITTVPNSMFSIFQTHKQCFKSIGFGQLLTTEWSKQDGLLDRGHMCLYGTTQPVNQKCNNIGVSKYLPQVFQKCKSGDNHLWCFEIQFSLQWITTPDSSKVGEFLYKVSEYGLDFQETATLPREFRNLKTHIARHLEAIN